MKRKEINGVVEKRPCSYLFRRAYVTFFLSLNGNCKTSQENDYKLH